MKKMIYFFALVLCCELYSNNITWSSPPTIISSLNENASDPQIAVDRNGDVIAVWIENNLLKSSTKIVNGNWTKESTISGSGASSPCIVSDGNGNATAIWIENGIVKASSKPFNESWNRPIDLSNSGVSSPSLCVDSSGDVVAAWVRRGNFESATKLFGVNWESHVTIKGTEAAYASISIGGSGRNTTAVAVWQGVLNGINVLFSSTKLVSGAWSCPQLISEVSHNAALPFVAVDSNANAIAIWFAYDIVGLSDTNLVVKTAARSSLTGNWSDVTNLSSQGIRNPSSLFAKVAFDSIGNAIAIWNISFDDQTFNIESAVKPVNGGWSVPVDIAISNLFAYAADLSVTTFGDVLSLYMFHCGSTLQIQYIESDINGFQNNLWSAPIIISSGSKNGYPRIAASLDGNVLIATAIWIENNGDFNQIAASSGSKILVLPPSNLSVTQSSNDYGVFTEYSNTLTWQASTDPNVIGYLIFRNGLLIAQIGADVLQFVDDNRTLNGSVVYSVTAIDSQQTQSKSVSIDFPVMNAF